MLIQKLNHLIQNVPPIVKNKYVLSLMIFGIWMVFFDGNNLIRQYQMKQALQAKEAEMDKYAIDIATLKTQQDDLQTDEKTLERFAREKFLMKRDNEEIILFVEQEMEDTK